MTARITIVALLLAGGAGGVGWLSRAEAQVRRDPLANLPLQIREWEGRANPPFASKVLDVLGVDDHVNRTYVANTLPVALYVGYYDTQRTGDTIHSPMKCLPGTGWQPLTTGYATVRVLDAGNQTRSIEVNRYIVQRGMDRYVVLFWYQTHGHVLASEYAAKARLMFDAIRLNRTDGALVRIMVPIPDGHSEQAADEVAQQFVGDLFPHLEPHLPS